MNSTTKKTTLYEANIDSFNISHPDLLELFMHKDEYKVVRVYPSAKEERTEKEHYYKKYFGRSFYNQTDTGGRVCPFLEVYVVHSELGIAFPVRLHNRAKDGAYTMVIAGMKGYKERSKQLLTVLSDIWDKIQDFTISRIDLAIDFDGEIPKKVDTSLLKKGRIAHIYKNTTYYNKPPQKRKKVKRKKRKRNSYVHVYTYNKTEKDNTEELSGYNKVTRLELQFGSGYIDKIKVKDLESIKKKIKKYVLDNASIHIKFSKLIPKKEEIINSDSTQTSITCLEIYHILNELKMMIHTYQSKMKTDEAIKNKELSNVSTDILKETIRSEISIGIKQMLVEFFGFNKEDSLKRSSDV